MLINAVMRDGERRSLQVVRMDLAQVLTPEGECVEECREFSRMRGYVTAFLLRVERVEHVDPLHFLTSEEYGLIFRP